MLNENPQATPSREEFSCSEPAKFAPDRWEKIRNRVIDEEAKGKTLISFAKAINEDVAVLAKWLGHIDAAPFVGRTVGQKSHSERIADSLEKHCERLDRLKLSMHDLRPMVAATTVTRGVGNRLETLRRECAISYIDAPSGVGKTEGWKQYIAQTRDQERFDNSVWVVTLTANDLNRKALLSKMVQAILNGELYGNQIESGMAEAIRKATARRGGLLIIDEAQHLGEIDKRISLPILNSLRSFSDAGCFGIALLGNGEIYSRLREGEYPQLTSRMDYNRLEIAELGKGRKGQIALTEQDVRAVMDAWGIDGNGGVDEWCLRAAAKPGALRYMTRIYGVAYKQFDGDVDADALKHVENLIKGNGR